MHTANTENNNLNNQVDARVVNLYQGSVNGHRLFANDYQYNVFAHYEKIEVQDANSPVEDCVDNSPLLRAYCARSNECHSEPQQTLLAFTDVVNDKNAKKVGYTQKQIDEFWHCNTEPLLFLSMLSLDVNQDYYTVLRKIDEIYADDLHLAYITFDFCNILIFSKGKSFQRCAEHILALDFSPEIRVVDSITLYSFAHNFADCLAPEEQETFGAYLRFGVADMDVMKQFEASLISATKGKPFEKNWIIGRHDIGILCPNANLNWLAAAWSVASRFLNEWYTSFTLSIMIQPSDYPISGSLPPRAEPSQLVNKMEELFEDYQRAYLLRTEKEGISADKVWLRWLHETSQQAVALIENKMTRELGVSLVPQFLDFFQYANTLWSQEGLKWGPKWDEAEKCFAALLSNTSILVDSMNHHSRQFIASPSFRTVAFEMPPKLMAYYTMVLHKLITVLQDKTPSRHYGFTITPQFTHTLNVRTLTHKCRDLLSNSQFITIGIGEEAMYQVQHTTAVLTHEISHFVGWGGRSREIRKKNILYVELYNTILAVVFEFYSSLRDYYKTDININAFCETEIPDMVKHLQDLLVRYHPEYGEMDNIFLEDVKVLLQLLPYKICNTMTLSQFLFECCWKLLLEQDGHLLELGSEIQQIECQRTGMLPETSVETLRLSKQHLYRTFKKSLQIYSSENYTPSDDMEKRWNQICELFSEAYADLQTILLLELDFESYLNLFVVKTSDELPQIELGRILALAVTLEGTSGWRAEDFSRNHTVEYLIQRYKESDRCSLNYANVDLIAIKELQEYLAHCAKILTSKFSDATNTEVPKLRKLYKSLSNENTALDLAENLSKEIQKYRSDLLGLVDSTKYEATE